MRRTVTRDVTRLFLSVCTRFVPTYTLTQRRRTRPRWRTRRTTLRRRLAHDVARAGLRGLIESMSMPGAGSVVPAPGVDGARSQPRPAGVMRTMVADWVAYRQPRESTAT